MRSLASTAYSIVSRTYKPQSAVSRRTALSGHRTGNGPRSRFKTSRFMISSIRPSVGLSIACSGLGPAVWLIAPLYLLRCMSLLLAQGCRSLLLAQGCRLGRYSKVVSLSGVHRPCCQRSRKRQPLSRNHQGRPLSEASQGRPLSEASQGRPLSEASQGRPLSEARRSGTGRAGEGKMDSEPLLKAIIAAMSTRVPMRSIPVRL
jgi:hypothetical protein